MLKTVVGDYGFNFKLRIVVNNYGFDEDALVCAFFFQTYTKLVVFLILKVLFWDKIETLKHNKLNRIVSELTILFDW